MSDISQKVAQATTLLNELADIAIQAEAKLQTQSKQLKALQAQVASIPKIDAKEIEDLKSKAAKFDQLKGLMG